MAAIVMTRLERHTRRVISKLSVLSQAMIIGACCLATYGMYEMMFVPISNARLIKYAFLILVIGGAMYFVCKPLVATRSAGELRDRLGFVVAFTVIVGFWLVYPLLGRS